MARESRRERVRLHRRQSPPRRPLHRCDIRYRRAAAQHRAATGSRHAAKYGITRLVHVEPFDSIEEAIAREKAMKKWRRAWKIELIERGNPEWRDLWFDLNR